MPDSPVIAVVPDLNRAAPVPPEVLGGDPKADAFLNKFTELMNDVDGGLSGTDPAKAKEAAALVPDAARPADAPAAAVDPMEDTKGMMPGTKQRFDKIKAQRDEFKAKVVAAEAVVAERDNFKKELEAIKAKPADPASHPDFEALKKERDDFSERLKLLDIERHPKFKEHWDTQIGNAENVAKSIVGTERAAKLEKIVQMPDGEAKDEQLEALASELTATKQGQLGAAMMRIRELREQRNADVTKTRAQWDSIQAKEREKSDASGAESQKRRELATNKGLEIAGKLDAFKKIEGNQEHNDAIAQAEGVVRSFFQGKLPENVMVAIPALAVQALHLSSKVIPALRAEMATEIKKRDDMIASLTARSPRAAGGTNDGKPSPKTDRKGNDAGSSFMDTFNANWRGPASAAK